MERKIFDISGHSEAERIALAQELMTSPIVDNYRNLDIIETIPLAEDYPYQESLEKLLFVHQANGFLPEIKPFVLEIVARVLHLENTEPEDFETLVSNLRNSPDPKKDTLNSLYVIETLMRNPDTLGFSKEHFKLATAHVGTELAARLYKSEVDDEAKQAWLAHIHYFAALECLMRALKPTRPFLPSIPNRPSRSCSTNFWP